SLIILRPKTLGRSRNHGRSLPAIEVSVGAPVSGVSAQTRLPHAFCRVAPRSCALRGSGSSRKAIDHGAGSPMGHRLAVFSPQHASGKTRNGAWVLPILRVD